MDVVSDQHRYPCWICDGSGRASLLADSSSRVCALCTGSGLVASVPSTTDEMVTALLAVPGLLRRKLRFENEARIDEIEQIVRACVAEMDAEDAYGEVLRRAPSGS